MGHQLLAVGSTSANFIKRFTQYLVQQPEKTQQQDIGRDKNTFFAEMSERRWKRKMLWKQNLMQEDLVKLSKGLQN